MGLDAEKRERAALATQEKREVTNSGNRTESEEEQVSVPRPRWGCNRGWSFVFIASTVLLAAGTLRGAPALGFIDPLSLIRQVFDSEATALQTDDKIVVAGGSNSGGS